MNNEIFNNLNVTCPNCGTSNAANTKFCVRCGRPIQNMVNNSVYGQANTLEQKNVDRPNVVNSINQQVDQRIIPVPPEPVNQQVNSTIDTSNRVNQSVNSNVNSRPTYSQSSVQSNSLKINYFKYILSVILKPFNSFKKEESKLSVFKNSIVLTVLIVVVLTVLNLISTMINTVRVTSFWTGETEWVWENLKNIEYFKVIGQNLLMYAGIIFAISGVYFLASLVLKKESKFVKLLSATTTAFIPMAVAMSILSPILSLINTYIGLVITIVGFVYFLVILLELLNDEIIIENKNTKIYFHLICLSILLIGGGFVAYKIVLGSLTSGLGSLGSLLG